jgi:hypothetical protein
MATVTVILYGPVIEHMRSWEGDIGRSVLTLCRRMRTAQRRLAPRKTGQLRRSIEIGYRGHWAGGLETFVGANPAHGSGAIGVAWWQEKGTRPHPIFPRRPGGKLVFYWPRVGQVVHLARVRHPGNPATHWAMRGAEAGMAAWR